MRIAVVNWSSRRVGGIEDYVSILIPALRVAGIDVAFWHELDQPGDRPRIECGDDVPDFCAAEIGLESALAALVAWKPDVLYIQCVRNVAAEARLLELAPAVFFLHTYTGTCISGGKTWTRPTPVPCDRKFGWPCLAHYFPHGCGGNNPATMWRLYQEQAVRQRLFRRYHTILTHTEYMRREMLRHGLAARVIAFPIEAQAPGLPRPGDGSWRLLYAGRMELLKGGHLLIDAMPAVVSALGRPVRLTMAGDGREREAWELRAGAVERAVPGLTVEFPGWQLQNGVADLMRRSDLLVVPSLWPEPFGSVGPAAGRLGLPAAAFAVGGIPQWLVEGVSGHLAPADPPTAGGLASAVVRCLQDPVRYAKLQQGARQTAATFTMERHMPELMAVLERAAAPQPAAAV
jgi:glycosyltransferase involved in cell wall biosynthesis